MPSPTLLIYFFLPVAHKSKILLLLPHSPALFFWPDYGNPSTLPPPTSLRLPLHFPFLPSFRLQNRFNRHLQNLACPPYTQVLHLCSFIGWLLYNLLRWVCVNWFSAFFYEFFSWVFEITWCGGCRGSVGEVQGGGQEWEFGPFIQVYILRSPNAYRCLVKEDDREAPSFLFESVEPGLKASSVVSFI